jgi:serine/threonine protein kinase
VAMHKAGLMHGDMKPGNILVQTGGRFAGRDKAALSDFGAATVMPEGQTSVPCRCVSGIRACVASAIAHMYHV